MGLFSFLNKSNRAYIPGCSCYFKYNENFEIYKKILSKLKIDFKILEKQDCCGLKALELGYEQEARKIARKNYEYFKENEISSIITSSPECYKMFLIDYPEFIPDWNIKVENFWNLILKKLYLKPKVIKNKAMEKLVYHDSCYLSRYVDVCEVQRKILESIGYEVVELDNNKTKSICCGSCGALPITNPKLADEIAKEKLAQVKRKGINKLVVSSLENYDLLSRNNNGSIEILDISEVLGNALGFKIRDKIDETIKGEEDLLEIKKQGVISDE